LPATVRISEHLRRGHAGQSRGIAEIAGLASGDHMSRSSATAKRSSNLPRASSVTGNVAIVSRLAIARLGAIDNASLRPADRPAAVRTRQFLVKDHNAGAQADTRRVVVLLLTE